ncbi:MAG: hypothetical protein JWM94_1542, partial [Sphingomonas bacterium]|nr:hypothetical protein [Sphingomonas bacterium]
MLDVQRWIATDDTDHAAKDILAPHFLDYVGPTSLPAFDYIL